nr:hypothetical protein [Parabacteroides goldsteinii]
MEKEKLDRLDYLTGLKSKTEEEHQEHMELLEEAFSNLDISIHLEFDENYKLIKKDKDVSSSS